MEEKRELELQLEGEDAKESNLFSLQDWIKQERIAGLKVQVKSTPPKEGEMGGELLAILSVVLAAPAIVELVKCIRDWIKSRKPKVKIKLQLAESKTVEIDAENLPETQLLIEQVLAIVEESKK